jgi:hypothetical protein
MKMKRLFASVVIATLIAVTASSLYAKEKSLAGTWTFSASQLSLRLVLIQKGKNITGTLDSPHGPISIKGEFSGGQVKFSGTSEGIQLTATGSMKSDGSLAGNLMSSAGDMAWTAVRAAAK